MRRSTVTVAVALLAGVLHAALLVGVAIRFGYDVGPTFSAPLHSTVRYGGLVVLGAVPVALAREDRLVVPLLVVGLLAGAALYWEVTPPAPTFQDVAEIEPSVEEPTGHTVVDDGLYLTKYMSAWYAWLVGAVLAGAWEHVVRARRAWLPDTGWSLSLPTDPTRIVLVAAATGLLHVVGSVGYALDGMTAPVLTWLWAVAGAMLTLGVPAFLLLRWNLAAPMAVAIALFLNSVHRQQYLGGPGDPHALYLAGWFVFLGIALLAGVVEVAGRTGWNRIGPTTR